MAEENPRTALAPSDRCMALSDRSFVSAGSFTSFKSVVSYTGTEGSPTVSEDSLHTAVLFEQCTNGTLGGGKIQIAYENILHSVLLSI